MSACYTKAMGGKPSKRPRPSYERGELRDKSIEEKQDPQYQAGDLHRLIKKAVEKKNGKAPRGASP
jgi:hypothetical protein